MMELNNHWGSQVIYFNAYYCVARYAKLSLHLYVLTGVNTMTGLTKAIDTTLLNQNLKFQPYIIIN